LDTPIPTSGSAHSVTTPTQQPTDTGGR
jgi:hypothetical protein